MILEMLSCAECSAEFTTRAAGRPQRFCSHGCKRVNDNARSNAAKTARLAARRRNGCRFCGSSLAGMRMDAVWCSLACSLRRHVDAQKNTRRDARSGRLCVGCGLTVPDGHIASARFCSAACRTRVASRKRRALKRSVAVEDFDNADVFNRDEWICQLCRQLVDSGVSWPAAMSASLDHILPLFHGGSHTLDNVQLAHLGCNMRKGARVQVVV